MRMHVIHTMHVVRMIAAQMHDSAPASERRQRYDTITKSRLTLEGSCVEFEDDTQSFMLAQLLPPLAQPPTRSSVEGAVASRRGDGGGGGEPEESAGGGGGGGRAEIEASSVVGEQRVVRLQLHAPWEPPLEKTGWLFKQVCLQCRACCAWVGLPLQTCACARVRRRARSGGGVAGGSA